MGRIQIRVQEALYLHNKVETILRQLPEDVSIKFMRPVGFYTNLFRSLDAIQNQNAITSTYGGDKKEPWVSPLDIAATIAEEMEQPFDGKTVQYLASDEVSPNEVVQILADALNKPDLSWVTISEEQMLDGMLKAGMNEWIANGFVNMQAAQASGSLYEDFYRHKPEFGKIKFKDFAKEFAKVFHQTTTAS